MCNARQSESSSDDVTLMATDICKLKVIVTDLGRKQYNLCQAKVSKLFANMINMLMKGEYRIKYNSPRWSTVVSVFPNISI